MSTLLSKYAYRPSKRTIKSMAPKLHRLADDEVEDWFSDFWEAFESELCVYAPSSDAKSAFAWAYERSSLVDEVTRAFLRYPLQAFKAERLSKLLLATSSDYLKHGLFTAYVRMLGMHDFKSVDVFEFKDEQHYQPFEKIGTMDIFSYFLHRKANPFYENMYLMDDALKGLDFSDLTKLIDLLEEKICFSRSNGVEDQPNLQAILVAMQSQHPEANVIGFAVEYWRKIGDVYRHSSRSYMPNAWQTIEKVIVETESQVLFDNAAAYMAAIPGMALSVDNILEIGFEIAATDQTGNSDTGRFTIAKSLGKKIMLAETQKIIMDWKGNFYSHVNEVDTHLQKFVFDEISPLLSQYQDALMKKTCPFNPKSVSERDVLEDIGKGNWLKLRIGHQLSKSYADTFDNISSVKIFDALTEHSSDLDDAIGLHFKRATDDSVRAAFLHLLEQVQSPKKSKIYPVCLKVFESAFVERLNEQGAAFLFEGATSSKQVIAGMKLLSTFGVKTSSGAILARLKNEDFGTDLLEYDLGL